jgi:hypothetical protein
MINLFNKGWKIWQGNKRKDWGKMADRISWACSETFQLGLTGLNIFWKWSSTVRSKTNFNPQENMNSHRHKNVKSQVCRKVFQNENFCYFYTHLNVSGELLPFQDKSVVHFFTRKMKAICCSEVVAPVYEITLCHFPKDSTLLLPENGVFALICIMLFYSKTARG